MPLNKVKISVCIPCFNSERTLRNALVSVFNQSFSDWEIILVNDGSRSKDKKGYKCQKILKKTAKEYKIPRQKIRYLEHSTNLGLLEARRTAINASNGDYIVILDSDDQLLPDALKILYEKALQEEADIVCCSEILIDTEGNEIKRTNPVSNTEFTLSGKEILDGFIVNHTHKGFLWGKIIKKSLYQKALNQIPFTRCTMAEDFLQYFFISYYAEKLVLIDTPVYAYYLGAGISSGTKIETLEKWEQICTAANVFTTIFGVIQEENLALTEEEIEALRLQSRSYLKNTLDQLEKKVAPELRESAKALLCDYWGEDFVRLMENAVEV